VNFIGGVNRILRSNGIIKGDDDVLTTFSDLQHNATSQLAQIAIQSELNDLISDNLIPYERAQGSITTVTGTRAYALAADFVRLYGDPPFLYNAVQNRAVYEFAGGENALRNQIWQYRTQSGSVINWYLEQGTSKQIALYQVPDANNAGQIWAYDYEKDVSVTNSTDTLPFQTESEAQAFCDAAGRRFKYLFEDSSEAKIANDLVYMSSRSRLFNLMRGKTPTASYRPTIR
jgi:hypothetical protein